MINYRVLNDSQIEQYNQDAYLRYRYDSTYFQSTEWVELRVLLYLGTERQEMMMSTYIEYLKELISNKCEKL